MSLMINVVVVLVCILLSAYLVSHKHDPVVVPMGAAEKVNFIKDNAALRNEIARKEALIAREKELRANYQRRSNT